MPIHLRPLLVAHLCLAAFTSLLSAEIVINEIHYHPVEEPAFRSNGTPTLLLWDDVHEFLEIRNTADSPADLSGWKLTRGVKFTFPQDAIIPPLGYAVIAKNPGSLRSITQYALGAGTIFGPWSGKLSNSGETIEIQDADGNVIDAVSYSDSAPWPTAADALGADQKWSEENPLSYQYRGRSLQRVSANYPSDLPENWIATGTRTNPTPGSANPTDLEIPDPVVVYLQHAQQKDGAAVIRPSEPAVITCAVSDPDRVGTLTVEYLVDLVDRLRDPIFTVAMVRKDEGDRTTFSAVIPSLAAHSIVRYRISSTVNGLKTTLSPRDGEPFTAHGYFVDPTTSGVGNQFYLYASLANKTALDDNFKYNPLVSRNSPRFDYGSNRSSGWNGTVSGYFAHDGKWWDVQFRYQGSPYFRGEENPFSGGSAFTRFKIKFPSYDRFRGQSSVLVMAKGSETAVGHDIVRHAGLPIAETESIRVSVNKTSSITRLLVSEMNEGMLERYHAKQARLNPDNEEEDTGHLIKASGLFQDAGPWGNGDGLPLQANSRWSATERYPWTYPSKNKDWLGYSAFISMLEGHVTAGGPIRGFSITSRQRTAIRNYASDFWDIPKVLDYYVLTNWMNFWDDNAHNYFYWQQRNGKWAMLPWDFDETQDTTNYNEIIGNQFERSFLLAFADEYEDRLATHVNSTLHPDELEANGFPRATVTLARGLQSSVNRILSVGTFPQPNRPTNQSPRSNGSFVPRITLTASSYRYSRTPTRPHAATLWEVRNDEGTYDSPVFRVQSESSLTSIAIPEGTLATGQNYFWRCTYFDTSGNRSVVSSETSFSLRYAQSADGIHPTISEIMADNEAAVEHDGIFPDWIEISNPSPDTLDLSGMGVSDSLFQPDRFVIPEGTVLASGESLVLWCTTAPPNPTGIYTGFGLNRRGDSVYLFAASRADGLRTLSDYVAFGHQPADLSIGIRKGTTLWSLLAAPTPGTDNTGDPASLGDPTSLRINEWMARPDRGDDWFELYNPTANPISLAGLRLSDQSGTVTTIAPRSYIAAGGYAVFIADGDLAAGTDHVAFSLDGDSDSIQIGTAAIPSIDSINLWNSRRGIAEGRFPEGTASYIAIPGGSKGSANPDPSNPDSDGDGMPDTWEIANGFDPNSASDALEDFDRDGWSNADEFASGTDPTDANSLLQLDVASDGADIIFNFEGVTGKNYRLQAIPKLGEGAWTTIREFGTTAENGTITHRVPNPAAPEAYFRLVIP